MTHWESVIRQHGPVAAQAAFRVLGNASDTEDAVQDAFLDALRLMETQPVRNWGALLRHLAVRRALDLLRRRHPWEPLESQVLVAAKPGPETIAVARERSSLLRQALGRLPERVAQVFALRYFGELSNQEIADTLMISSGAVAVALHQARTELQVFLKMHEE